MKKILSGLLSLLILCTSTLSVSAEDITVSYDSTVDESSTILQNVGVQAEAAEIFAVTLPKSVTLTVTDEGATSGYTVNVTGDIASNHYVRVIPLPDSKIKDADEVYAYDLQVTQDKKRWGHTELDGSVTADGTFTAVTYVDDVATPVILEPGKYDGIVQFALSCDDAGFWTPATCTTPATCSGYDTNDNGVLDWGEDANQNHTLDDGEDLDADGVLDTEYLATTITRGSALGHKFPENCVDFPAMCERCKELVYGISNPEQYTAFVNAVNVEGKTLTGCEVVLCNDIDLSGITYDSGIGKVAAGYTHTAFNGTFDGCGFTISNLTIADNINDRVTGIFNTAGTSTVIKNVTYYAPNITANEVYTDLGHYKGYSIGGLLAVVSDSSSSNKVHIENVTINKGSLQHSGSFTGSSSTGTTNIGGIVGNIEIRSANVIKNCAVYDFTIVHNYTGPSTYVYAGGIAGFIDSYKSTPLNAVISCVCNTSIVVNAGTGSYTPTINGFVGYAGGWDGNYGGITLKNCVGTKTQGRLNNTTAVNCKITDTLAAQEVVDILNTDQPGTWILDLEGKTSGGYPVLK